MRTKQRPEISVYDDDYLSNFVALSTISDWERLVQLNVVDITPDHFDYDDGYSVIDMERFDELVSSILPAPVFSLSASGGKISIDALSKMKKNKK